MGRVWLRGHPVSLHPPGRPRARAFGHTEGRQHGPATTWYSLHRALQRAKMTEGWEQVSVRVHLKEQQGCFQLSWLWPQPVLPELALLEISKFLFKCCILKHNCGMHWSKDDQSGTLLSQAETLWNKSEPPTCLSHTRTSEFHNHSREVTRDRKSVV